MLQQKLWQNKFSFFILCTTIFPRIYQFTNDKVLAHCEAHSPAHLLSLFIISIHLNVWLHLIAVSCRTPLIGLDQSYMWCSDRDHSTSTSQSDDNEEFSIQISLQKINAGRSKLGISLKLENRVSRCVSFLQWGGEGKLMQLSLLSKGMLQFNKCGREFAVLYSFLCSLLMVVLVCIFAHWQCRKVNVMYMQSRS